MVNRYLWDLYLQAGGKEVCRFFQKGLSDDCTQEYAEGIRKMQEVYCVSRYVLDDTQGQILKGVIPTLQRYKKKMQSKGKTPAVFNVCIQS